MKKRIMLQQLNINDLNNGSFVINNKESALQVASLLMTRLQKLQSDSKSGQNVSHSLQQLKKIVFYVYFSSEQKYTNVLHQVVSYMLIHIL